MRLKKIVTVLLFGCLSILGAFFGCTNKYEKFSLEINGESTITLSTKEIGELKTEATVQINIKNAPNNACKKINYSVSKANIVTVTPVETSLKDNIAIFKISTIENISSYEPSCVITFESSEGNKSCTLNVNIVIPVTNISKNEDYSPYVVAGDLDEKNVARNYYIDTASLITFSPSNTTQRDVKYSLVDASLKDRYDINLTEDGAISIGKVFDNSNTAIPKTIKLLATSVADETKSFEFAVNVLRAITNDDISVGYKFDNLEANEVVYTGSDSNEIGADNTLTINSLEKYGIILASNKETERNVKLNIGLKAQSGLDFNTIDVSFEKNILTNSLLEYVATNDLSTIKQYKIYSVNPGIDVLIVNLNYKGVSNYSKTIVIPITVREMPISLIVNENNSNTYNIFDYYEDAVKGQEFKVNISKAGAYDKTFKVLISENDFDKIEVRLNNELLSYENLTSMTFENNTSLFIRAKSANELSEIKIIFVSCIVNDINNPEFSDLFKEITLRIMPGIRSLNFASDNTTYYLQSNEKTLTIQYKINGEFLPELSSVVELNITKGSSLIKSILNYVDEENKTLEFILTSNNNVGDVEFYLYSENGVQTPSKKIHIYNYYDESIESQKFSLNLDSNNIKVVEEEKTSVESGESEIITKYFIGLSEGKNSANFKVNNPQNATIYDAIIESSDESIIKTSIISKNNLTFNLFALSSGEDVEIRVKIKVFNNNEEVNNILLQDEIVLVFKISTYSPITNVQADTTSFRVVDGMVLDYDSREKELNYLKLKDYIKVEQYGVSSSNMKDIKVDYIMPSNFKAFNNGNAVSTFNYDSIDNEDYALKENGTIFNDIIFFAGKNQTFNYDGELTLTLAVKIYNQCVPNDYYLVTIRVVLYKTISVDKIELLNKDGFVYLENSDTYGQINAEAYSTTLKAVTNSSLNFVAENNNSIDVDRDTGIVTVKAPGITKVRINANDSKYNETDEYSEYIEIYVVVADGSKVYPYILDNASEILNNKYYTLKQNLILNGQLMSVNKGGINGKFAYSKYSSLNNENAIYRLIYKTSNLSLFESDEIEYNLQNLDIIIDCNKITTSDNFGFIAKVNNGTLENVNLSLQNVEINSGSNNIGLLFAENKGEIINSSVTGSIVLQISEVNFGGFVAVNNGKICGNYDFITNANSGYNVNLKIKDYSSQNSIVAGVVAINNSELSNLKVNATIISNANLIGGIVGQFNSNNSLTYKNLYFTGSLNGNSNSVIGGIAAKTQANNYELLIVNLIRNTNNSQNLIYGRTVGGLFGETTNTSISFSYVESFVDDVTDINGNVAGGLVGSASDDINFTAVYSNLKMSGEIVGAFVGTAKNININNAYTYSTGANYLINSAGTININKVYATNCNSIASQVQNVVSDKTYLSNNFTNVINNSDFNDGNYFVISNNVNNGYPYLVYNKDDQYKKLLTIAPENISVKFVTKTQAGENYYGIDKNIIVINDSDVNKAVVYFKNNLVYKLDEIFNMILQPSDADWGLVNVVSSNESVIKISNNMLYVLSTGTSEITFSYKNIQAKIYFNVVEKITAFTTYLSDFEGETFTISKGNTKSLNYNIENKTTQNGIAFIFNEEVEDKLLLNNALINNKKVYTTNSTALFTGYDTFASDVKIYPYYSVSFAGQEYNLCDIDFELPRKIQVINGATSISSDVSSVTITKKQDVSFNVYVSIDELVGGELRFISSNPEASLKCNFVQKEYDTTKKVQPYVVTLSIDDIIVKNEISTKLKIYHSTNKTLYTEISVTIKSTELVSVELNHYASEVIKYDDYNSIIKKESVPTSTIVTGNLGVLNINLYPSYANITSVEIFSSVENNNYIMFSQLAYNKDNNLVVVNNNGNIKYGLKLDVNKSKYDGTKFVFDGNLYVSTLLSTLVTENTIFTITVICYTLENKTITTTIDLTAIALTSVVLTNDNGSNDFYLAKGASITLNQNIINFDESMTSSIYYTFEREINKDEWVGIDDYITSDGKNYIYYEILDNKLIVSCDILTPRNTKIRITPKFNTYINNQKVEASSSSIILTVVDFVVNDINIENAESGILLNNLGNSTILKAKLDVVTSDGNFINDSLRLLEYSNIQLKIKTLEELISKDNLSWNIITETNNGTIIYNNIRENGAYSNFKVGINDDKYYYLTGKIISNNNLALKVSISYENGLLKLSNSGKEFLTNFVFSIKTHSSLDNPIPVTTALEFLNMEEGLDYILLNDITLDSSFKGLDTKISSFDGNNKIINIQGFTIDDTNITNLGLFTEIGEGTTIKNVTVNLLPTAYYVNNNEIKYGLDINAQELNSLNFGIIAGTNNGVITNCKVVNNNVRIVNKVNLYKDITITVTANESSDLKIGLIAGVNNGYITHSSVNKNSDNSICINSVAQIGGFVSENNNKIASSLVRNITIYNNAKSKLTAGFVAKNNSASQIITSYAEGISSLSEADSNIDRRITDGGIFANSYVGGFATINSGTIKDCYSNILISTNKRSAGFVYDNTNGYVETSFSESSSLNEAQSFQYFTGNNEENLTLNNNGIKYCYYLIDGYEKEGSEDEYSEPAYGISEVSDSSYFEGFICDDSTSTVWVFGKGNPKLYDAEQEIVCERKLLNEDTLNQNDVEKYEYIYINNNIGSINNPIIVSSTDEFLYALTNKENLYSYYYNNKINDTNINYNHISIVKDLDLSEIIDISSKNDVQKLQDIIFAGNLNGNGMTIKNITIAAKNNANYSSFGLFKQIGVELSYNSNKQLINSKLDKDNCSVIKNLNLNISSISATITTSVGSISGEVINSKLYNISVTGNNNVVVTGSNIVGGIAGRISGNSFVKGVSSDLSVLSTYDNKSNNYNYICEDNKKVYKNVYTNINSDQNNRVSIAGGLFGVVDIYKTTVANFAQYSDEKSYYVIGKIDRENDNDLSQTHIQFTKVIGNVSVYADIAGGLFGYVESGSKIYDARFVLNENSSQSISGDFAVGGIAGKNKGYLTYATVELELNNQRAKDKLIKENYKLAYLFGAENNKATYVGGLVGIQEQGILENSYSKVNIVAKNSIYVGSAVGLSIDSTIDYVYAVSYLEAQDEIKNNNVIMQSKGYAGFIGKILSYNGSISHIVSIIRNEEDATKFNLASLVGYNSDSKTNISSSQYSNNISYTNFGVNLKRGETSSKGFDYSDFENGKNPLTFDVFNNKNWVRSDRDVYYRLTYNKKGAEREVSNEEELYNALSKGGTVKLISDIYLTKPWSPVSYFKGTLTSAERPYSEQNLIGPDGKKLGQYYKIFNLNINSSSSNVANNVGLFAQTNKATIENITIVVGSAYNNYDNKGNPDYGIYIVNQSLTNEKVGLAVISGNDNGSNFSNITIDFVSPKNVVSQKIQTNLPNVGSLVGYGEFSSIEKIIINNCQITKKSSTKIKNTSVGILAGNLNNAKYINNIKINSEDSDNIKINSEDSDKSTIVVSQNGGTNYIGGLAGKISLNSNENINIIDSLSIKNIDIKNEFGKNIYAGGLVGELQNSTLKNSKQQNIKLSIESQESASVKDVYVGGVVGSSRNSQYENIKLSSDCKISCNFNNNKNAIIYLGDMLGKSENNTLSSVILNGNLEIKTNSENSSYIGGLIGYNESTNIVNVIVKTYIKSNISSNVTSYIGGLIGYNSYNNKYELKETIFLGNIKSSAVKTNYIGSFIGANIVNGKVVNAESKFTDTNDKCYFIEDLSLVAKRDIDFGTAISYQTFVENKDTYLPSVRREENLSEEGSVYCPYELNIDNVGSTQEYNYYILNSDLNIDNTINEIKGIIAGNGHTINIKNTLVETISDNAVLSSLSIILKDENNTQTFNTNSFTKEVYTILAKTNNGAIYNLFVTGNMYLDATSEGVKIQDAAPIALENNGYINVVTSKAHIVYLVNKPTGDTKSTSKISGFVANNSGTILNSVSVGNIEICENTYNILSANNYFTNLAGFASTNSGTIANIVSAMTLPKHFNDINYFVKENNSGNYENCVVDIFANGNYDKNYLSETFTTTENIYSAIVKTKEGKNENTTSNIWINSSIEYLYGYTYPIISSYASDDKNFVKNNTLSKTLDGESYLVNNFGTFKNIVNTLKNKESGTIKIKQIASFNADISSYEINPAGNKVSVFDNYYTPIILTKELNYNGNNFAIYGLTIQDKLKVENGSTTLVEPKTNGEYGLFVNKSGVKITIKNLALKDISYKISYLQNSDIFAGAFVALSNGTVNLTNCFAYGSITYIPNENKQSNNSKDGSINIGGLVGSLTSSEQNTIKNNLSAVKININGLESSYESQNTKTGYDANIGGIVGNANNANIEGNVSTEEIICSSVKTLNMGGIVGSISSGKLNNNKTISKVIYNGAYLGYYKDNYKNKIYNINAVVGYNQATLSGNQYNNLFSFVKDNYIKDETLVTVTNLLKTLLSITDNNFVLNNSETTLYTLPNITTVNGNTLKVESNQIYLVESNNITFAVDSEKDLVNTSIIFMNECSTNISEQIFNSLTKNISKQIFNSLTNCTIVNLTINSNENLITSALAKEITNCYLQNITLNNICSSRTDYNINSKNKAWNVGLLADYAENSVLDSIIINNGRLEVKYNDKNTTATINTGAVVGYCENSLISNSTNSATVTTAVDSESNASTNTSGFVGVANSSSLFNNNNKGLIYAKNNNGSTRENVYVSGITNCVDVDGKSHVSFCVNNGKIKAVNSSNSSLSSCKASGISINTLVLYSINNGNVTQISTFNSQKNNVATGLASANVYFSYNKGAISSPSQAFALTSSDAFYSYSFGSGYSPDSGDGMIKLSQNHNSACENIFDINSMTGVEWYNIIANATFDMVTVKNDKVTLVQNLLLEGDELKSQLIASGDTYLISSAYELWYWGRFVCGTNVDKNVKLIDDVDMTGFNFENTGIFTKVFDGANHTILNLKLTKSIIQEEVYYAFIPINQGTIKNIYFENPQVYISSDITFKANNYISIVCGQNSGTIENILVGATDEITFININDYSVPSFSQADTNIYIGTLSAINSGTVQNSEVLNLQNNAIYYDIKVTKPSSILANNVYVNVGGLVGQNKATISNCAFLGIINGSLVNQNMYGAVLSPITNGIGVGNDTQMLEEMLFGLYSKAETNAGLIVGKNENNSNVTNCYVINKISDTYLLQIKTESLHKEEVYGRQDDKINWNGINNIVAGQVINTVKDAPIAAKSINKLSKVVRKGFKTGDLLQDVLEAPGKIAAGGIVGVIAVGIDIGLEIYQMYENANSCKQNIFKVENNQADLSGSGFKNCSLVKDNESNTNESNTYKYISSFLPSEETDVGKVFTGQNGIKSIPFLTGFLNLSTKMQEPKKDGTNYYVYNVNELAYALTQLNDQTIILMDNIDMSRSVWDFAENIIKSNTLTTNNFKIVYGNNSKFKDEFTKIYSDILVEKTNGANEYGKFDVFKRNSTYIAYANFEERFKKAWKEGYKAEQKAASGNEISDADCDLKLQKEGIITGADNNKIYKVQYKEQLEVIADAMSTYTIYLSKGGQITHKGISFKNRTIYIDKDLDITSLTSIISLNYYNYERSGFIIADENGQTNYYKELPENTDAGSINNIAFKAPKFVEEDDNAYILFADILCPFKEFAGTLEGKNHTIKSNNSLFHISTGTVQNLTIERTDVNVDYIMTPTFGIIYNYGTISNVNVNIPSTLKYTFSSNFVNCLSDTSYVVEDKDNNIDGLTATINMHQGILTSDNYGTITNCGINIKDNKLDVYTNIVLDYTDKNTGIYYQLNADENPEEIEVSKVTFLAIGINQDFGLFAGNNMGIIDNANIENVSIENHEISIKHKEKYIDPNGNQEKEREYNHNNNITVEFANKIGFISGANFAISSQFKDSKPKPVIQNINIYSSKIYSEGNAISIGCVSGYNTIDVTNVNVIASEAGYKNGYSTSTESKVDVENEIEIRCGGLFGEISPALLAYKTTLESTDGETEGVVYYKSYVPTVTKSISTNQKMFGRECGIKIEKTQKLYTENKDTENKEKIYYWQSVVYKTVTVNGNKIDSPYKVIGYYFGDYKDTSKPIYSDNSDNTIDTFDGYGAINITEEITIDLKLVVNEKEYAIDYNNNSEFGNESNGVEFSEKINKLTNCLIQLTINGITIYKRDGDKIYYTSGYEIANVSASALIDPDENNEPKNITYMGEDFYIIKDGKTYFVKVELSGTITGTTLTVTRNCTTILAQEIQFTENQTFNDVLPEGVLISEDGLTSESIVTEGIHIVKYNDILFTVTFVKKQV